MYIYILRGGGGGGGIKPDKKYNTIVRGKKTYAQTSTKQRKPQKYIDYIKKTRTKKNMVQV